MKKALSLLLATFMLLALVPSAVAETDSPVQITVFHYMVQAGKAAGLDAVSSRI